MRSRVTFFILLFVAGSLALPLAAHAGGIPFFGPIIDPKILDPRCALGWGAMMIVINNIISLLLTLAIVFVAPLMIAYSGFLFVVNPVNSEGISKAKGILLNTIVGIVVALAGWLIVDALMAVLYNPGASSGTTTLGTWSSLISTGDALKCLPQKGTEAGAVPTSGPGITIGGPVSTAGLVECADSNTACSPYALQAAGFTTVQANVMSCIAVTESSGNPSLPPYNIANPGSNSTACGLFQITKTTWNTSASGACSDFSNCTSASCNIQVAQSLVTKNGYSDWTCANCNSKAAGCVQKYGG